MLSLADGKLLDVTTSRSPSHSFGSLDATAQLIDGERGGSSSGAAAVTPTAAACGDDDPVLQQGAAAESSTAATLRPLPVPLMPAHMHTGCMTASAAGITCVSWWGPNVLAIATGDGRTSLVRVPGSVNILGAAPPRCMPGCRVAAACSGSSSGCVDGAGMSAPLARGLLVCEPLSADTVVSSGGDDAAGALSGVPPATALEAALAADATAAATAGASSSRMGALTRGSSVSAGGLRLSLDGHSGGSGGGGGGGDYQDGRCSSGRGGESAALAGFAGWLSRRLGIADEAAAAAAKTAAASKPSQATSTLDGAALHRPAGWRLTLLAERSPSQLVQAHLRAQDWGSALQVSRLFGLDTDVVYLARWAASAVNRASIADNLPRLRDRRAALNECLTRVALVSAAATTTTNYISLCSAL